MTRDDEIYGLWERDEVNQGEASDIEFLRFENECLKRTVDLFREQMVRSGEDSLLADTFRTFLQSGWTLKSLLKDVEDFVRSRKYYAGKCEEQDTEGTGND